jgi:hypothetical protein
VRTSTVAQYERQYFNNRDRGDLRVQTDKEAESVRASFLDVSIDFWRLTNTVSRLLGKLDATDQPRLESQLRYFARRLEQNLSAHGLRLVTFDGSGADPGLPVTIVNREDFESGEDLLIAQTLEPAVVGEHGVERLGSAMARKRSE